MASIADLYKLSKQLESAIELADSIKQDIKPSVKSGLAIRLLNEDLLHSREMLKYLLLDMNSDI